MDVLRQASSHGPVLGLPMPRLQLMFRLVYPSLSSACLRSVLTSALGHRGRSPPGRSPRLSAAFCPFSHMRPAYLEARVARGRRCPRDYHSATSRLDIPCHAAGAPIFPQKGAGFVRLSKYLSGATMSTCDSQSVECMYESILTRACRLRHWLAGDGQSTPEHQRVYSEVWTRQTTLLDGGWSGVSRKFKIPAELPLEG